MPSQTRRSRLAELVDRAGLGRVPRRVLFAGILMCAAAVGWATVRWWPPQAMDANPSGFVAADDEESVATATPDETAPPEPALLYVHVVGAVMRPGVYQLVEGARVSEAIALAGGLTGNAAERGVNLARPVVDGEQVVVPTEDEMGRAGPATSGGPQAPAGDPPAVTAGPAPSGPVNVNTADAGLLETLPGIGPATAAKIIADREENGPFASIDDLLRVSGIGEKKLEALRGLITVG